METMQLHIQGVSIGYGPKILHSGLEASVHSGQILAVLGLNGSGKSTLIRTISGLDKPIAGGISLDAMPVHTMHAQERAKCISVVLTGRDQVIPSLRVFEILQSARAPYTGALHMLREDDKRILSEVAQWTGIEMYLNRALYALSDGEAQKVFIARALVQDTPVILLDEPTSHLDIIRKWEIYALLQRIAAQGKIIVCATHDVEHALHIAQHCLLLQAGGEHVLGATEDLIRSGTITSWFKGPAVHFDTTSRRFIFR